MVQQGDGLLFRGDRVHAPRDHAASEAVQTVQRCAVIRTDVLSEHRLFHLGVARQQRGNRGDAERAAPVAA